MKKELFSTNISNVFHAIEDFICYKKLSKVVVFKDFNSLVKNTYRATKYVVFKNLFKKKIGNRTKMLLIGQKHPYSKYKL